MQEPTRDVVNPVLLASSLGTDRGHRLFSGHVVERADLVHCPLDHAHGRVGVGRLLHRIGMAQDPTTWPLLRVARPLKRAYCIHQLLVAQEPLMADGRPRCRARAVSDGPSEPRARNADQRRNGLG
jgi:hypothetical protein